MPMSLALFISRNEVLAEMNKKIIHTNSTTDIARHHHAPTGKDLPLFNHLDNHSGLHVAAWHIRFTRIRTQCSSLDLHLITDRSNKQIIQVFDSERKEFLREIPFTDLQYITQVNSSALRTQANGCKRISGIEVASSLCSALEVL